MMMGRHMERQKLLGWHCQHSGGEAAAEVAPHRL
jgi:hypothetical protein